jgi:hypothetical protein
LKTEYREYTVHMTVEHPAWNEHKGVDFAVTGATSKSDAIKQARRMADAAGYDRSSGRKTFTATVRP